MIGGMVGNNSSGTTSIQYGVTRDKVLEMQVLLSDGSEVTFGELSQRIFTKVQTAKFRREYLSFPTKHLG